MSNRDRRAVWWGAGAIVLATLALKVGPWAVRSIRELRAKADAQAELVWRARRAVAAAPAARDSLAHSLSDFLALASRLVAGQTNAEAAATLSGLVSERAMAAGLKLAQLDQLSDSSSGTFARVSVKGALEGDVRGLTAFVAAVEQGEPVLSLDALAVTATNAGNANPAIPEALRIEVTLHGWYVPRAAGGKP